MKSLIFFAFLALVGCNKSTLNEDLIGVWKIESYEGESENQLITFSRVNDVGQFSAFVFDKRDKFKYWNHGWCGTPPLAFFFDEGEYSVNESDIDLDIDHYYLNSFKDIKIEELSDAVLKLRIKQ